LLKCRSAHKSHSQLGLYSRRRSISSHLSSGVTATFNSTILWRMLHSFHARACTTIHPALFPLHISQDTILTGRGRHQFSRQQPAILGESEFHGTTSECRPSNSASSTNPAKHGQKSLSRSTYKSCLPLLSLVMSHIHKLAQNPPDPH
jgi:hypothetical protein